MILDRQGILSRADRATVLVDIGDNDSVHVRSLSVREQMQMETALTTADTTEQKIAVQLSFALSDADGVALFSVAECDALLGLKASAVTAILKASSKFNGYGDDTKGN
jgi:protein-arginine kinase